MKEKENSKISIPVRDLILSAEPKINVIGQSSLNFSDLTFPTASLR